VKRGSRPTLKSSLFSYLPAIAVLAIAIWFGRSRSGPDLVPVLHDIFPGASRFEQSEGIYAAYSNDNALLGWAATGSGSGFGGPMVVLVGLDTTGSVVGGRVVDQRETPLFFRMVRAPSFFTENAGTHFTEINYDYSEIVGVTGATMSSEAIVSGVRDAVTSVAGPRFNVHLPQPEKPFEFGILELVILLLFVTAVATRRFRGRSADLIRWSSQVTGLIVIGFWKNSPITVAKITALMSGYFPDIRSNLALYLLIGGFLSTALIVGRSIYCTHVCPFGAIQQLINLIGGKQIKFPQWASRLMIGTRDVIVFSVIIAALAMAQPALASYEPFAALFALKGTVLQWFLLFIVMVASLFIHRPWCNYFCPVRSCDRVVKDLRKRVTDPVELQNAEFD